MSSVKIITALFILSLTLSGTCWASSEVQLELGHYLKQKHLLLNIPNDSEFVLYKILAALESKGFRVEVAGEGMEGGITVIKGLSVTVEPRHTTYYAVTELHVSFTDSANAMGVEWRAVLKNRQSDKTLGSYRYSSDDGWDNERIISDMIDKLIHPTFNKEEVPVEHLNFRGIRG